jgi:hypothetical protein
MRRYRTEQDTKIQVYLTMYSGVVSSLCMLSLLIVSLFEIPEYTHYFNACAPGNTLIVHRTVYGDIIDWTAQTNAGVTCTTFAPQRDYSNGTVISGYWVQTSSNDLLCSDTLEQCLDTKKQIFIIWPWILMLTLGVFNTFAWAFVWNRWCALQRHLQQFQQVHPTV